MSFSLSDLNLIRKLYRWWRPLRVTANRGFLKNRGDPIEKMFLNITNLTDHDLDVERVWVATGPVVHVLNPERVLPYRLKPGELWTTWHDLPALPAPLYGSIEFLGRVKLTISSRAFKSVPRPDTPEEGFVAGRR